MSEHHLRHAIGTVGRHIGDDDAQPFRLADIDHIVSGGHDTHVLESRQLPQHRTAEHDFIGKYHIGIGCPFHNPARSSPVVE